MASSTSPIRTYGDNTGKLSKITGRFSSLGTEIRKIKMCYFPNPKESENAQDEKGGEGFPNKGLFLINWVVCAHTRASALYAHTYIRSCNTLEGQSRTSAPSLSTLFPGAKLATSKHPVNTSHLCAVPPHPPTPGL